MHARVANHYPTHPFRTVSEYAFSEARLPLCPGLGNPRTPVLSERTRQRKGAATRDPPERNTRPPRGDGRRNDERIKAGAGFSRKRRGALLRATLASPDGADNTNPRKKAGAPIRSPSPINRSNLAHGERGCGATQPAAGASRAAWPLRPRQRSSADTSGRARAPSGSHRRCRTVSPRSRTRRRSPGRCRTGRGTCRSRRARSRARARGEARYRAERASRVR